MTVRNDRVMIVERDIIHPQQRSLNALGASPFVRRQVLEQVGVLDEDYYPALLPGAAKESA